MPATSTFSTTTLSRRFVLSQSSPGTVVVAAAESGLIHKVIGFYISTEDGKSMTWRFTSGSPPGTNISGTAHLGKDAHLTWTMGERYPFCQTSSGEQLNFITTGTAARGVVIYCTEAY